MVDLDSITLEATSVQKRGSRTIVEVEGTFREVAPMSILERVIKTRAKGRALISTGIVNTTLDKIKGADIQKYARVESLNVTDSDGRKKDVKVVVIIER